MAEVEGRDRVRPRRGRTISLASLRWSSMSAISPLCMSRLSACSATPRTAGRAFQRARAAGGPVRTSDGRRGRWHARWACSWRRRRPSARSVHVTGGRTPGWRRLHDGVDDRAAREEGLVPDDDVNSDDVQQNRELLEASSFEVLGTSCRSPKPGRGKRASRGSPAGRWSMSVAKRRSHTSTPAASFGRHLRTPALRPAKGQATTRI